MSNGTTTVVTPSLADAVTAAQTLLIATKGQAAAAVTAASTASSAASTAVNQILYGILPSDPGTRPGGGACQAGDLYFNSAAGVLKMFNAGAWTVVATSIGMGVLLAANNLADLPNSASARANLGLTATSIMLPGVANGIATLDSNGLLVAAQLPVSAASLVAANNLSDLINVITARTNLGLGTAAVLAAGSAAGVATLDGTGKVPMAQIPTGANNVSTLNASGFVPLTQLNAGNPSGIATLNSSGIVPSTQLPAGSSPTSIPKSANYTTVAGDSGKVIGVTAGSGADITITLVGAATAGDGASMIVQKVDTGTAKVIVSDGTARAWLSTQWDLVSFRSDGTLWDVFNIEIMPRVETFTVSGTWTKPPLARAVYVSLFGGGGGGASGVRNTGGAGGSGGGGGSNAVQWYNAVELSATETVTVATAAAGGLGQNTPGTGLPGTAGGPTSFGTTTRLLAGGGLGGGGGGIGGLGGSVWGFLSNVTGTLAVGFEGAGTAVAGADGWSAVYGGASAGTGNNGVLGRSGGSSAFGGGGGGGGGGGPTTNGGAGGQRSSISPGGGGASSSGAGNPGSGLGSGGGGGAAASGLGQAGGAGDVAGGGGGGGNSSSSISGAGGAGGRGQATITTYF